MEIAFEDLHPGREVDLGLVTVDRDEMVAFARRFDPQPFHLDEPAGRQSLFGGLCASGWFTACLWMRAWVDQFLAHAAESYGSPGIRHLRWSEPVFPDDVLRCGATVDATRYSRSRTGLGIAEITGWCERAEARVLSCEFTAFFRTASAST